ncbi:MAG: hypothetical protein A3G32_01380 [Deltaproteobacteria bacterium RIFCSPLOWO2_12_FULL_40_28]|nr:MAG: hypothetical protein A3C45_10265 [Deltaproteobacteria bacterium RIFCSPHIGHO2_02_FULL_40_28]OGQ19980.1 MAG: hypothetical protein A3E27_07215 [Deltaproteobacteria bacterium RIFCSPHIGHO2_12_FULL_40_32]OGQ39740.1 MAG: hypothetical protein A3I69_06645 [Deltaproteobacteria bacterium RIFCSPLOWO2_02_FULL_40_36]OGQ52995.1 MAG: hypothetical protein A3G32_01380 [Deltaproteobacteria bacterium RIFCSPLOWO2_12_FULL_40_28]
MDKMQTDLQIIIAGAGLGGLASALALKRNGFRVSLYEQGGDKPIPTGLILHGSTLQSLQSLEIAHRVVNLGFAIKCFELRHWNGVLLKMVNLDFISKLSGFPLVAFLRSDLHKLLADEIGGASIFSDHRVLGYYQDSKEATLIFSGGRRIAGDLLIGADGMSSCIRKQLVRVNKLTYTGVTSWRGISTWGESKEGVLTEYWGKGMIFGYVGIGGGKSYWYAYDHSLPNLIEPAGQMRMSLVKRFETGSKNILELLNATPENLIFRTDIYDHALVKPWMDGLVILVGDAAHPVLPSGFWGASLALEDAVCLAQELGTSEVSIALQHFQKKRIERVKKIKNYSKKIWKTQMRHLGLSRWLRDIFLKFTPQKKFSAPLHTFEKFN